MNSCDSDRVAFETAFHSATATNAIVLPSTPASLAWIPGWRRIWPDLVLIAPRLAEGTTPQEVLAQAAQGLRPSRVVIFADQLTEPQHATIPVRMAGDIEFYSGVEAVLHLRYNYTLLFWPAQVIHAGSPHSDVTVVMNALRNYFVHCVQLGEQWLQRDAHAGRKLTQRIKGARRELRYLESVIFHAYRVKSLDPAVLGVLHRIDQLSTQLKDVERCH